MAKGIHKGSELSNISETWDQNEKRRESGAMPDADDATTNISNDLEQTIKEEAAEYDNDNKENRLLGGERATVNDDIDNDE